MSATPPRLDAGLCRGRQEKLRRRLDELGLDAAVFFHRHYVYALSGYWHEQPLTPTAILVKRDGGTTVVAHDESPEAPAADEIAVYAPNDLCTLKPNLSACATEVLNPLLAGLSAAGVDESAPAALLEGPACRDITEDYQYLRRSKDADEVAAFEYTVGCAERAYAEALQMMEPGLSEVELMAAMQEAATFAAGEILSGWGQDFACGAPGGFARRRFVEAGELYVLDIGVGVRGYRCDLCRTFAVDGHPTEEQLEAHARILEVMERGEAMIRPGQSCKEMYEAVFAELDGWKGHRFFHHAGHGVGLDAHEVPRINPAWDDTFAEGDLVAFEPGLYGESLQGGIRLENNYLVTESGHRCLSRFPLDLVRTAS